MLGNGHGKRTQGHDLTETPIDDTDEVKTALSIEKEIRARFEKTDARLKRMYYVNSNVTTTTDPEPSPEEKLLAYEQAPALQKEFNALHKELRLARQQINIARERAAKQLSDARRPHLIALIQKACACADILAAAAQSVQDFQLRTVELGGAFEYPPILSRFVNVHGLSSWEEEKRLFAERGWL